jgi:hypothetical protein
MISGFFPIGNISRQLQPGQEFVKIQPKDFHIYHHRCYNRTVQIPTLLSINPIRFKRCPPRAVEGVF